MRKPAKMFLLFLFGLAATEMMVPAVLQAEEVVSRNDEGVTVRIQAGDTLSRLAAKYLSDPMKWHALMRHNDIRTPDLIRPGVVLTIPFELKETSSNPAEVVFATPNEIYYDYKNDGRHLWDGDFIPPEGMVSANQGTALLRLPDRSKFHMEPDSVIEMKGFFESKDENGIGIFRSFLRSVEGRIKFEVTKLIGDGRFEVETPKGIVQVKGTAFAIEIASDQSVKYETYEGEIAIQPAGGGKQIVLAAGQGAIIDRDSQLTRVQLLKPPVPGDVVQTDATQTTFRWAPVAGAQEYIVFAGGDAGFEMPIRLGKSRTPELQVERLPAGDYFWNVIAVDETGMRSPAADPKAFRVE